MMVMPMVVVTMVMSGMEGDVVREPLRKPRLRELRSQKVIVQWLTGSFCLRDHGKYDQGCVHENGRLHCATFQKKAAGVPAPSLLHASAT
mmetsp:Transcript_21364/g.40913  ORF Transcript_21364/g.40913 Transcript_21364/m.40913 type:complete len:90 (+) Transcript_21364:1163-1432(+)